MTPVEIDYYCQQDRCLNYAALAYAVYSPGEVGPEYAMARIEADKVRDKPHKAKEAQTLEMIRLLEEGHSYRTITKQLGLNNSSTVWWRVKRWRDKHGSGNQS